MLMLSTVTCSPCSAGTYPDKTGQRCVLCDIDAIAPVSNMTKCRPCGIGQQTVRMNRTACVPCSALWDAKLVEYVPTGGCKLQCASGTYAVTIPYMRGGCAPCTTANAPVGTYNSTLGNCILRSPCINLPG